MDAVAIQWLLSNGSYLPGITLILVAKKVKQNKMILKGLTKCILGDEQGHDSYRDTEVGHEMF